MCLRTQREGGWRAPYRLKPETGNGLLIIMGRSCWFSRDACFSPASITRTVAETIRGWKVNRAEGRCQLASWRRSCHIAHSFAGAAEFPCTEMEWFLRKPLLRATGLEKTLARSHERVTCDRWAGSGPTENVSAAAQSAFVVGTRRPVAGRAVRGRELTWWKRRGCANRQSCTQPADAWHMCPPVRHG